jgi:NAD/NADP transhydrogenase alpha subunit
MSMKPAITPPAAVAVIGLGNMGVPMASRLIHAGFQVTGFDLSEAACRRFSAAGGRVAKDAVDAVKMADVVITHHSASRWEGGTGSPRKPAEQSQTRMHYHGDEFIRPHWHTHAR